MNEQVKKNENVSSYSLLFLFIFCTLFICVCFQLIFQFLLFTFVFIYFFNPTSSRIIIYHYRSESYNKILILCINHKNILFHTYYNKTKFSFKKIIRYIFPKSITLVSNYLRSDYTHQKIYYINHNSNTPTLLKDNSSFHFLHLSIFLFSLQLASN